MKNQGPRRYGLKMIHLLSGYSTRQYRLVLIHLCAPHTIGSEMYVHTYETIRQDMKILKFIRACLTLINMPMQLPSWVLWVQLNNMYREIFSALLQKGGWPI